MAIVKYLSRKVTVADETGNKIVYGLTVISIRFNEDTGLITDVSTEPYVKEIAGVEYTDNEISAVRKPDGTWMIKGIDRLMKIRQTAVSFSKE